MQLIKVLWIPCVILSILVAVSIVTYFLAPPSWEGLRNLALNLVTEIAGILLTIFLIDRVLRSKEQLREKEERRKYQTIALRHLKIPITNHLRVFTNILKAVSHSAPQKSYESVRELFDEHYFSQLELLDFSKNAPLLGYKWSDYLVKECTRFKDALTRTLDRYSPYLDSELIELMEQIINSSFLDFVVGAPKMEELNLRFKPGVVSQWNLFREKTLFGGAVNSTRKYTERFSLLVEYYNQHVSEEKTIKLVGNYWHPSVAPRFGSGRIEEST